METLLDSLIRYYDTEIRRPGVADSVVETGIENQDLTAKDHSTFPYLP